MNYKEKYIEYLMEDLKDRGIIALISKEKQVGDNYLYRIDSSVNKDLLMHTINLFSIRFLDVGETYSFENKEINIKETKRMLNVLTVYIKSGIIYIRIMA